MDEGWIVRIREEMGRVDRALYIFRRVAFRKAQILKPNGEIEMIDEGAPFTPFTFLNEEMLSALADELKNIRIQPKDAGETAGKLEAQTQHLKDLRKLLKLDN